MERLISLICIILLSIGVYANEPQYTKQGNKYVQVSRQGNKIAKDKPTVTSATWEDTKGKVYVIYLSERGRAFILKPNKQGELKRRYLGEKISKELCKEYKIEYK